LLVRVPQHQRMSGVYVIQVARVAQPDSQTWQSVISLDE
jgi:hypothetical protein